MTKYLCKTLQNTNLNNQLTQRAESFGFLTIIAQKLVFSPYSVHYQIRPRNTQ
jgi:hypothetical protein